MQINNEQLVMEKAAGMTFDQLAAKYSTTTDSIRGRVRRARKKNPTLAAKPFVGIAASSLPKYDHPLRAEGEAALILCDLEAPYHHADFVNRCLDLAQAWNIEIGIFGGDVLHFDQFSHWEANWTKTQTPGDNLTPETAAAIRATLAEMKDDDPAREKLEALINPIPVNSEECSEMAEARRVLEVFGQLFKRVDFVLGNHDARFLHALDTPLLPQYLLNFIGGSVPKWNIAPMYYSYFVSKDQEYRIEHPRSAADITAVKLADKFDCNTIVGHAHSWSKRLSTNGKHFAIMAGCCCDELLMPYAAQRSNNRPAHSLGAVIVRDGYPFLLHPKSPWDTLKRM